MAEESDLYKPYPITSLCKADILERYEGHDHAEEIRNRVRHLTPDEMRKMADAMAMDYCGRLFWESLDGIFMDLYFKPKAMKEKAA